MGLSICKESIMSRSVGGVVAFVNSIIIGGESVYFLTLKLPDRSMSRSPEKFIGAVFVEPYPYKGNEPDDGLEDAVCSFAGAPLINPVKLKMASLQVGMSVTVTVGDDSVNLEPVSEPDYAVQVAVADIVFTDSRR
jgi:hypothetical protein